MKPRIRRCGGEWICWRPGSPIALSYRYAGSTPGLASAGWLKWVVSYGASDFP